MVGDAEAVGDGKLVGGDVEAGVELHFVGVHDFEEREAGGKVEGEAGLAGAGGAQDNEKLVLALLLLARGGGAGGYVGPAAGLVVGERMMMGRSGGAEVVDRREQVETRDIRKEIEIEIRIMVVGVSWEGMKCHRKRRTGCVLVSWVNMSCTVCTVHAYTEW
ncbi:hypothetical protein Pyn_04441 [Prunus yedoensis var. nudiflora]|uniref:Uncharacterized protein n=1 Tax=Prunus yedoensis var. nudiflora TaxID=2094558 RepID=A0A314YTE5_PRUYE|nr:hypothetical protein Pyn_04441 [Prunus yedoensis var. nudiflora]